MIRAWFACAVLAGCVDEHDAEVFAVLPAIDEACVTLDAATLAVAVTTLEGEQFTVTPQVCQARLAGEDIAGFQVTLDRLADGYHRLDARILSSTGAIVGSIARPFTATQQVAILFARADLPGWPTATLALSVPGCADPEALLHVTATPSGEADAVADVDLPCRAPVLAVPRGSIDLVARVTAGDGTCSLASAQTFAFDDAPLALAPTGSCP